MPFTFTMPKLSPTMEEGTIAKWHKKVGDHVAAGDLLLEVATDKATVEHEALDGGWLRAIIIPEGGQAIINAPIAIFTEEKDESIEGYTPKGTSPDAQEQQNTAATSISDKQPSTTPVKESSEIKSPATPTISFAITSENEKSTSSRILASPLAKKLAAADNLDLKSVKGSGPGGRIMKRDLANARPLSLRKSSLPHLPAGTFEEIALTPMRKVIAQRLQEAKATIPHFYVQQNVAAEALIDIREQLKHHHLSVTYNDLAIKAVALALRGHPEVNSGFNASKNALVAFKTIDISVAVSIEGGLITPIITHADYKSVLEISAEVKELAIRAKAGKLAPNEYQGGSFTISNMGMYGITNFQAIINPPQAAILAISGIEEVPVVKDGKIVPGQQLCITLSVDHRAIDGVAAAKFIKKVQHFLENPAILLL